MLQHYVLSNAFQHSQYFQLPGMTSSLDLENFHTRKSEKLNGVLSYDGRGGDGGGGGRSLIIKESFFTCF